MNIFFLQPMFKSVCVVLVMVRSLVSTVSIRKVCGGLFIDCLVLCLEDAIGVCF